MQKHRARHALKCDNSTLLGHIKLEAWIWMPPACVKYGTSESELFGFGNSVIPRLGRGKKISDINF